MRLLLLAVALWLAAAPALAQDTEPLPRYGTATLVEGFEPDPHIFDFRGGGDVAYDVADCGGFIHDRALISEWANFELTYDTSGARDLYIYATSSEDTVLLVRLSDGSWACDDDSYDDGDPLLRIPNAEGGLYAVWVGTPDPFEHWVRLRISEVSPF